MSDEKEPVFRMDPSAFRVQDPAGSAAEDDAPASSVTPPPARAPRRPRPPVRRGDLIATIVLLVLLVGVAALASVFAFFLTYAASRCSVQLCSYEVINAGIWFSLLSPWFVALAAIAGSIVLLVQRRLSFWLPLTAAVLIVALWLVGAILVWAGV